MIERKHIKPYKYKLISNKVKYSTYAGQYCTANDVNMSFRMTYFPVEILLHITSKLITRKDIQESSMT